jgi:hypothetical protein
MYPSVSIRHVSAVRIERRLEELGLSLPTNPRMPPDVLAT